MHALGWSELLAVHWSCCSRYYEISTVSLTILSISQYCNDYVIDRSHPYIYLIKHIIQDTRQHHRCYQQEIVIGLKIFLKQHKMLHTNEIWDLYTNCVIIMQSNYIEKQCIVICHAWFEHGVIYSFVKLISQLSEVCYYPKFVMTKTFSEKHYNGK